MTVEDRKQAWPWWWLIFVLTVGLALIMGFVIGAVTPHAIAGDDLWRSFITGPPVAGLFAIVAALIAFAAAAYTARVTRRNAALAENEARTSAENAERWKRIEWSANKALSSVETEWRAGFAACEALIDEGRCTPAERTMLQAALGLLSREAVKMDADNEGEDNGRHTTGGDQIE